MLTRLNDLPLRYKIALLSGVPLLFLLLIGSSEVSRYRSLHAEATRYDERVERALVAGELAHELQKERGASAGFLGSGGERFGDALPEHRRLVDTWLSRFGGGSEAVGGTGAGGSPATRPDALVGMADEIRRLREAVDASRIPVPDQVERYTRLVDALLGIGDSLALEAPTSALLRASVAFSTLQQVKERSGLERALLARVFAAGAASDADLERFVHLAGAQTVYLRIFEDTADATARGALAERLRTPAVAEVERMRQAFVGGGAGGAFGIDSERWFERSSERIDILKVLGDEIAADLVERSATLRASSGADYRRMWAWIVVAVVLSLTLAVLIGRSLLASIRTAATLAEGIASGDLARASSARFHRDESGQLLRGLDGTRERLQTIIESAQRVAESVRGGSRSIREGHADLARRTDEQAHSLEDTTSSMEQIATTTRENATSAERADSLAREARERAGEGKETVSAAVVAMDEINESSRRIASIVGVIDEIAFQTNLLALNAAVEAARAGSQGRGFAVVASEVRELAGRSASAAKEIKTLIDDSVGKVETGAHLVGRSGQTLGELAESISGVSALISGIAETSREQALGVDRIHQALARIDGITQQNLSLVQSSAAESERMDREADELADQLRFFQVRVA